MLSLINTVVLQGVKFLLTALLGPAWVAVFELADKLLVFVRSVSGSLLGPLMPAFANLYAGNERERIRYLYLASSKLIAATSVAGFGFLAVFADRLIFAWTDQDVPLAVWTIRAVVLGEFAAMLTGVATSSLRAQGTLKLEAAYAIFAAIVFLSLLGPGFYLAGYEGVVYARVTGAIISASWFLHRYFRQEGFRVTEYLRSVVVPSLGVGAIACSVVLLGSWAMGRNATPTRWGALGEALAWGVPYALVIAGAAWVILLTREESLYVVNLARRYMPWLRRRET